MFPTVFFYKVSIRGMPAITWETKVFQLAAGTPTATILTASGSTLQTFDPVNTSSRYGGDLFITAVCRVNCEIVSPIKAQ